LFNCLTIELALFGLKVFDFSHYFLLPSKNRKLEIKIAVFLLPLLVLYSQKSALLSEHQMNPFD